MNKKSIKSKRQMFTKQCLWLFSSDTSPDVRVLRYSVNKRNLFVICIKHFEHQGRSHDFSKGGSHGAKTRLLIRFSCRFYHLLKFVSKGGHTVSKRGYSPDFHVAFTTCCSCLPKTWLTKGGSRAPQDPPWLRPCWARNFFQWYGCKKNFTHPAMANTYSPYPHTTFLLLYP